MKNPPVMTRLRELRTQSGKVGWILLWALGVPIPVLLVLFPAAGLHLIASPIL